MTHPADPSRTGPATGREQHPPAAPCAATPTPAAEQAVQQHGQLAPHRSAAAPEQEQRHGPAAHPRTTPAPTAGYLRVRPMTFESTASYLHRLAGAYRLTLPQLLDALHITVSGRPAGRPGTGTTEIHLDPAARQHLAACTGIPTGHLERALPRFADPGPLAHRAHRDTGTAGPLGAWYPLDPDKQPVPACPTYTLRHSTGATDHTLAYLPAHHQHCPHHRSWSTRHRHILDVAALPALAGAQSAHQRLLHHRAGPPSLTWATVITTRWYDHQHHPALNKRWQQRLSWLATTNPAATTQPTSLALTARAPVTYPETIALARYLATTPLTTTPGLGPRRHTDPATTQFLGRLAHHLHLPTLHPDHNDPLWTWIHHHTQP
jgi:hypothetical protein